MYIMFPAIRSPGHCLTLFQERLLGHAEAFDGLLSLIPAKIYYGADNSVRHDNQSLLKISKRSCFTSGSMEEEEADEGRGCRRQKGKARSRLHISEECERHNGRASTKAKA